jgi:hypothetical protein
VTLNEPAPPTVYSVKLTTTSTNPVNNNTTLTNQYTTTVSVSPELPSGTVINFNISHNNKFYYSPSGITASSVTSSALFKNDSLILTTSNGTVTSDANFNTIQGCQSYVKYLDFYTETWDSLTFTNSDSIVINTVTTITNNGPLTPCTYTLSEDLYNIYNATISGCGCCIVEIVNVNQK